MVIYVENIIMSNFPPFSIYEARNKTVLPAFFIFLSIQVQLNGKPKKHFMRKWRKKFHFVKLDWYIESMCRSSLIGFHEKIFWLPEKKTLPQFSLAYGTADLY